MLSRKHVRRFLADVNLAYLRSAIQIAECVANFPTPALFQTGANEPCLGAIVAGYESLQGAEVSRSAWCTLADYMLFGNSNYRRVHEDDSPDVELRCVFVEMSAEKGELGWLEMILLGSNPPHLRQAGGELVMHPELALTTPEVAPDFREALENGLASAEKDTGILLADSDIMWRVRIPGVKPGLPLTGGSIGGAFALGCHEILNSKQYADARS